MNRGLINLSVSLGIIFYHDRFKHVVLGQISSSTTQPMKSGKVLYLYKLQINIYLLKLILKLTENPNPNSNLTPPRDKLFLNIIMSDLLQTFRISSISPTNMIYYVKDDPILQVSSQELSKSSKSQI